MCAAWAATRFMSSCFNISYAFSWEIYANFKEIYQTKVFVYVLLIIPYLWCLSNVHCSGGDQIYELSFCHFLLFLLRHLRKSWRIIRLLIYYHFLLSLYIKSDSLKKYSKVSGEFRLRVLDLKLAFFLKFFAHSKCLL